MNGASVACKATRILLVDDQEIFRRGLRSYLAPEMEIHEAGSCREACDALAMNVFDCILLDLELPDVEGLAALPTIRERDKYTPIIVISAHDSARIIKYAREHGAQGYLPKQNSRFETLPQALAIVEAGGEHFPSAPLDEDLARLRDLTKTEIMVLTRVAAGDVNKEIANRLNISLSTVKTHLDRIFEKLPAKNRADATRIALRELGILVSPKYPVP